MNILMKTQQLQKMNQASATNSGGAGGNQGQAAPPAAAAAQAPGGGSATPAAGAPASEAAGLGYEIPDEVSVGEYGGDGQLKQKEQKPHEKVKLAYEIENTDGLPDDEVLAIKEFAARNRLSKETAKAYVEAKKQDVLKVQQAFENQKQERNGKVLAWKKGEIEKLKAEIGGEGGKDFNQNLKKVKDFLGQHLPELKKGIDEDGIFLSASIMKGLFNLQAKLKTDDKFVPGGAAQESSGDQPAWAKRYSK